MACPLASVWEVSLTSGPPGGRSEVWEYSFLCIRLERWRKGKLGEVVSLEMHPRACGPLLAALGLRPGPAAWAWGAGPAAQFGRCRLLQATHCFDAQSSAQLHPERVRQGLRVHVGLQCFRYQRMQELGRWHDCSHEWCDVCHRSGPTFDAPEVSLFVLWHTQLHRGWLRDSELLVIVIMMRYFS